MATPNHGWLRTVSVKSSWATWIQYSCGSLMKIQIAAATSSQTRAERRAGSQRSRTTSYAMKKYSNVLGKTSSSQRSPMSSNSATPTSR